MSRVVKDDPRTWPVIYDERAGVIYLTLPDGIVQTYEEDAVAEMVVQVIQDARDGKEVDERWVVTLRHLCGEERWQQAVRAVAMEPEIVEALLADVRFDA